VLAPAIRDSHSLTECDLRDNNLGKEGWCAIFDALRDNPQDKITKWDLSGESIDAEIAKSLAAYMAVSGSLTSINLSGNIPPDSKDGPAFAKALGDGGAFRGSLTQVPAFYVSHVIILSCNPQ